MEISTSRVNVGCSKSWFAAVGLLLGSVACGPLEAGPTPVDALSTLEQEQVGENGLTTNGLTTNGLTTNGLTTNGLTTNGLTTNGFATWFATDAGVNATMMKYVVRCALPEEASLSYEDPSSGSSYTWQGGLGLAQGWASGQPMTEAEQQLVSACLAAHLNKFGMHVPLSVLGVTAQQQPIAYTTEELQSFPRREACFFGNLFTQEGIFAGVDRDYLNAGESTSRACGLTTRQDALASTCAPLVHVQSCEQFCTLDPSGLFYTQCTYNGRTYLPLTTRIRSEDVFTCGDGVCQVTESCGTGSEPTRCMNDCGTCP
jgi:hypothetical protein